MGLFIKGDLHELTLVLQRDDTVKIELDGFELKGLTGHEIRGVTHRAGHEVILCLIVEKVTTREGASECPQ